MGVQKFTISRDLSGQTIQVIPVAEADKESDKVYSAHELDEKNKITLIADGEAPVIRGLEIMEDRDLIDRRDGSITIRASAEDELSGVKDFYIVISNSDNAVMKPTHRMRMDTLILQLLMTSLFLAEISRCWGMLWTMLETKIV